MNAAPDDEVAELRRANAELQQRLDEAVQRETATAEVLGVINSSPSDLKPVFDAILEKAHSLCGVEHGALATYDGEYFRRAADRGMPEWWVKQFRQPYRGGSHHERLLRGERYVQIDARAAETPQSPATIRAGSRTILMVPLRKEGALLGFITAHRREVRPFSDSEIALLEAFAAQAVIAMENARLISETRESLEQQTATSEVLGVINSSPGDLTPVFDAILEKATDACDAAYGNLWTYDGERFHPGATYGNPRLADPTHPHPPRARARGPLGRHRPPRTRGLGPRLAIAAPRAGGRAAANFRPSHVRTGGGSPQAGGHGTRPVAVSPSGSDRRPTSRSLRRLLLQVGLAAARTVNTRLPKSGAWRKFLGTARRSGRTET
jgi:hypothetical protein